MAAAVVYPDRQPRVPGRTPLAGSLLVLLEPKWSHYENALLLNLEAFFKTTLINSLNGYKVEELLSWSGYGEDEAHLEQLRICNFVSYGCQAHLALYQDSYRSLSGADVSLSVRSICHSTLEILASIITEGCLEIWINLRAYFYPRLRLSTRLSLWLPDQLDCSWPYVHSRTHSLQTSKCGTCPRDFSFLLDHHSGLAHDVNSIILPTSSTHLNSKVVRPEMFNSIFTLTNCSCKLDLASTVYRVFHSSGELLCDAD